MQTFGLNYDVKPDRTEEFKETLMQLIEAMKACEGHIETRLYIRPLGKIFSCVIS